MDRYGAEGERRELSDGLAGGRWLVPASPYWLRQTFASPLWPMVCDNIRAFVPWRDIAFVPGLTPDTGMIAFAPLRPEDV